jgi:hypothetical protein
MSFVSFLDSSLPAFIVMKYFNDSCLPPKTHQGFVANICNTLWVHGIYNKTNAKKLEK